MGDLLLVRLFLPSFQLTPNPCSRFHAPPIIPFQTFSPNKNLNNSSHFTSFINCYKLSERLLGSSLFSKQSPGFLFFLLPLISSPYALRHFIEQNMRDQAFYRRIFHHSCDTGDLSFFYYFLSKKEFLNRFWKALGRMRRPLIFSCSNFLC